MPKTHLILALALSALTAAAGGNWVTEGFEAFRRGTFGNAGQNLYVSKAGVLQRIYQFDLDHNGWFDLVYANCQNHHESAPSYVYAPDGRRVSTLPGQGATAGTVADLDGDGFLDLVVCGRFDMVSPFATTDIYYGSPDGEYSERYHVKIQTPWALDCCHGRFAGEKRPTLVFAMPGYRIVRVYAQTDLGFEWKSFTDLPVEADLLAAADLDGDGFDDLVARKAQETRTTVYWGGADGLSVSNLSEFAELPAAETLKPEESGELQSELEQKSLPPRLLQAVEWNGRRCFTLSTGRKMIFVAAGKDRRFVREAEFDVPLAYAVTVGDFNRDGLRDLAFAAQVRHPDDPAKQASLIWLNSADGFTAANRRVVETCSACCIDSIDDKVLIGQCEANRSFTNDALLFTVGTDGTVSAPRRFEGESMHRVFFVRNPGREDRIFIQNNYGRSSVGYDKAYVYWGAKDGYDPKRMTAVPGWCAVDAVSADLDDDGWAELLVCNNSENSLHLDPGHHVHHFGPKGFEPERTFTLETDVGWGSVISDFDRDGYLDVITSADHWYSLYYFHGGPEGLARCDRIPVLTPPEKKAGVSKTDAGDVAIPKKGAKKLKPGSGGIRWINAADINRDGFIDVLLSTFGDRALILWGGPDGRYTYERRQEYGGYRGAMVNVADLDRNGYPDIIFGGHTRQPNGMDVYRQPHNSYVHVYWNGPEGIRESRKSVLRADAAASLAIADYDGNGWLDIFAGSYLGEVDRDINSFIYWNRGGNFAQFDRQDLITHAVSGCIGLDFNEDGFIDLAVANHKVYGDHAAYSEVWWGGREGYLPTRTTRLPTCGPHGMCAINPGNIMTRGPEEFYFSEERVADADCTVTGIEVEGEIPPKTWVKAHLSVNGGAWREPEGVRVRKGDRLQYRLELGAANSLRSPRVTKVTVMTGASAPDFPVPPNWKAFLTREGTLQPKSGHVQGMCVTSNAVYMTLYNGIYRYDWHGRLVKRIKAGKHTGDICWWNGRLYTACDLGEKEPRGRIEVYDEDLNFIKRTTFRLPADGIACLDGTLYVGLGPVDDPKKPFRGNWFGKFDPDTLAPKCEPFIVDHGFDSSAGVQNIATDGRLLYVNFYTPEEGTPCFFAFDRDFNVKSHHVFGWRNGMDVIGGGKDGAVRFVYVTTIGWMGQHLPDAAPPQGLVRYAELTPGGITDISRYIIFQKENPRE